MIMLAKTALVRSAQQATDSMLSFYAIIQSLSLTGNLLVCVDAGDSLSYDGTSQTWTNRKAGVTNYRRGSGSGSDAADPTFNGAAGGLSTSDYFSFDGGDYFDEVTTGWGDDAFHANNAEFTIAAVYYTPSSTSAQAPLFGNDGAGATGVTFRQAATTRKLEWIVTSTSGTVIDLVSTPAATTNAWNFAAIALDENTGASGATIQVNTSQQSFTSTYTDPDSGTADEHSNIGARGNGNTPVPSGTRLMGMMIWSTRISNANLTSLYNSIKASRVATLP